MKLIKRLQLAIEKSVRSTKHDEAVLQQSNRWIKSITWGLVGTTGFALTWLVFAKTEEIIVAPGNLVPLGSVQEIQMPMAGIVDQILVKDGDQVIVGQVLIRLDAESSKKKLETQQEGIIFKKLQLGLKREELNKYLSLNRESVDTLRQRVIYEKDILSRLQLLESEGATAKLQYLQQRNTVHETKGRLKERKLDGLRQKSILEQNIQSLKTDISNAQASLKEAEVNLRYQELRAPISGVVFDLLPKGPGFAGRGTETLLKIVPSNALEAKVEIPSSDIGFVRKGMKVDLSIDSFPATDFGVLSGTVSNLGSDALPPEPSQQKSEYRYPATITLSAQTLKLRNGDQLSLQPGMSLSANIKLRKVSYLQLLLGSFSEKTDSLRQL